MGFLKFVRTVLYSAAVSLFVYGLIEIAFSLPDFSFSEDYFTGDAFASGIFFIIAGVVFLVLGLGNDALIAWRNSKQPPPKTVQFTSRELVPRLEQLLALGGYSVSRDWTHEGLTADLYANRKGPALFGVQENIFFFLLENGRSLSINDLTQINNLARKYVNSKYKLPASFRWYIPLTAPVFVSPNSFSIDVIDHVRTKNISKNGDTNAILLVDTQRQDLHALEKLPASGFKPIIDVRKLVTMLFDKALGS